MLKWTVCLLHLPHKCADGQSPLSSPLLGPHVRYIPKPDNKPCSITDSVRRFPTEEATEGNATSPPQNPPTNLTVVTVEGCPSFVILDWEKPLNDTVTGKIVALGWDTMVGSFDSIVVPNQAAWVKLWHKNHIQDRAKFCHPKCHRWRKILLFVMGS